MVSADIVMIENPWVEKRNHERSGREGENVVFLVVDKWYNW